MSHEAGAGAEDRQIAAALLHQAQLVRFDRLAKLVVADLQFRDLGRDGRVPDGGDLAGAPRLQRLGSGCVMPVAINDHLHASCRAAPSTASTGRGGRTRPAGSLIDPPRNANLPESCSRRQERSASVWSWSGRVWSERIPGRPLCKLEIVEVDPKTPAQPSADGNHDDALRAPRGETQAPNKVR